MTVDMFLLVDGVKGESADASHPGFSDIDEKLEKLHIESAKIASLGAFKTWVRQSLRTVLPHEVLCCGVGRLNSGSPSVDGVVSINYPTEILESIRNKAGGIDSPLLRRWLIRRAPITFSGGNPWPEMSSHWLEQFRKFDLRNAAVHAVSDDRMSIGILLRWNQCIALSYIFSSSLQALTEKYCHTGLEWCWKQIFVRIVEA